MEEIKKRAENAMHVSGRNDPQKDIEGIRRIVSDIYGANRLILSEMLNAISDATEAAFDRNEKIQIARELISKAETYCVKDH